MPKTKNCEKNIENTENISNTKKKIEIDKREIGNNRKSLSVNAILNILKQCCSILFPLISYPYVTRVLGSQELGKYSFADSVVQYFILFAFLGIPTYAVREGARVRNDREKIRQLSSELFTLSLMAGCISCAVLILLTRFVPKFHAEEALFLILGIRVITTVLGRDWINTIYEDFLYITVRYIALQILSLVMIFLLVKDAEDIAGYTAIMLIGTAGADILNVFYTQRYVTLGIARPANIRNHLWPVLYLFSTTIAINIYIHSDVTILGFLRTSEEVGVYALTSKVYLSVKALLNALIMVMIPRVSFYLGAKDYVFYQSLLKKLRRVLYLIVIPCIAVTLLLSRFILSVLGGEEYLIGAQTLRILCIALFFAVFGCYYSQAILVPNRQERYFFHVTVGSAVINIVLNFALIPRLGINGAAITTVLAEMFVMLACRWKARGCLRREVT